MTKLSLHSQILKYRITIAAAMIGAIVGAAVNLISFSDTTAISIFHPSTSLTSAGELDVRTKVAQIVGYMDTPDAANAISAKLGALVLPRELIGRHFGGEGKLRVRKFSDGMMVEIRVTMKDPEKTRRVASAAAQVATDWYLNSFRSSRDLVKAELEKLTSEIERSEQRLMNLYPVKASNSAQIDLIQSQIGIQKMRLFEIKIKYAGYVEKRESMIIADGVIYKPILSSLLMFILVGVFAGLITGYAVGIDRYK
jgi:hypothetical protein